MAQLASLAVGLVRVPSRARRSMCDICGMWMLAAPLPALVVGLVVMAAHEVATPVLVMQVGAAMLGFGLAVALARRDVRTMAPIVAAAGIALTAATLLTPGLEGVHRWLGPLQIAPLAAPWVLFALATGRPGVCGPLAVALQAIHLAQPDAGQATAFGVPAVLLLLSGPGPRPARLWAALAVAAASALAWTRPAPLDAVAHVEGIFALAVQWSPVTAFAAPLALLLLAIGPLAALDRRTGSAMALYLTGAIAVTASGAYPVPVLGFGAAHVVGAWTAMGLLASTRARRSTETPSR